MMCLGNIYKLMIYAGLPHLGVCGESSLGVLIRGGIIGVEVQ